MMSMLRRTWPTVKATLAIATFVGASLYSADRLDRQERVAVMARRTDPVVTGSTIPFAGARLPR